MSTRSNSATRVRTAPVDTRLAVIFLVGLLTAAGCATNVQPPPQLYEVCQTGSHAMCQSWAYAGERVELRLVGLNLSEVWEVDLGNDDPPLARGSFRAWIGPVELDQVRRAQDAYLGQETLIAELRSGLPLGFYPVEIETPGGQRAVLGGSAFEIRDPLRLFLDLDKPILPRGDTAQLTVTVQNRGTAAIDRVALELSQGGSGAFRLPMPQTPFELAGLVEQDVVFDLEAGGVGVAQLAVIASGLAAGGVPIVQQTPVSTAAQILEPAGLELTAVVTPQSVSVGQPFQVQVLATNPGEVAIREARLDRPEASGAGQVQWAVDPDQILTIEPGAAVSFSWSGTATASGTAWITTSVDGLEAISQREVGASLTGPIPLEILSQ